MKSLVVLILYFALTGAPYAQTNIATKGKVVLHSKQQLSASQKRLFRKFSRKADFFGAFYISTDGSVFAASNMHSLKAADRYVRTRCEFYMRQVGERCIRIASIQATSETIVDGEEYSVSRSLALAVKDAVPALKQGQGYSALARAGVGLWGTSLNEPTAERAERVALKGCWDQAEKIRDRTPANFFNHLYDQGFFDCSVTVLVEPE